MKKIIAIMLAALMLLSLAACGKTTSQNQDTSADTVSGDQTASTADNEAAASTAGKIAVVFATGGLGDKTYNDSLYAGVKNVCDTMGLQFDYSEPMDAAEYAELLDSLVKNSKPRIPRQARKSSSAGFEKSF